MASAKKYDLDARLIASVTIVESRGNPFAISGKDAIGIMQIHLPTWGRTADKQGINLFKIEDNVDFGAQILKDYKRVSDPTPAGVSDAIPIGQTSRFLLIWITSLPPAGSQYPNQYTVTIDEIKVNAGGS